MAIAPEQIAMGSSSDPTLIINAIRITELSSTSGSVTFLLGSGVGSVMYRYYRVGTTPGSYSYTNSGSMTMTSLLGGYQYILEAFPTELSSGSGEFGPTLKEKFLTTIAMPAAATTVETVDVEGVAPVTKGTLAQVLAYESSLGITSSTTEIDPEATTQTSVAKPPTGPNAENLKPTNSVFQLSNKSADSKVYISAEKQFSKVDTSKSYYSFGTTIFLKSTGEDLSHAGGFMFFSRNSGREGYFVSVESSALAAVNKKDPFKIYKVKDGQMYPLDDSQTASIGKYGAIFGGQAYKIDILVKKTSSNVYITAYINGFKITATDSISNDSTEAILSPTDKLSLICTRGTVYFDYVYAMNIEEKDYIEANTFNIYEGKFSDGMISLAFGSKVISNPTTVPRVADIDEFGPVAREIRHYKVKYKTPSFPAYPSTGANNMVRIIGKKMTSFGAELFVINNSGTYIPLVDDDANSLWILGKSVSKSNYSEYVDDSLNKYNTPYPVTFESKWIQNNSDAVALANWIKGTWGSKKQIVSMTLFGNPLLSVGDIIKIHYPYNDMDGSSTSTEKYVITSVEQQYSDGLSTTVTCRTL